MASPNNAPSLLHLNLHAADSRPTDPSVAYKHLDGSIKRNTAFIKKLKTLAPLSRTATDTLLLEAAKLKLDKYIQEAATAMVDCCGSGGADSSTVRLFKTSSDFRAAVEVASHLHQRYKEFTDTLETGLMRILAESLPTNTVLAGYTPEQREREEGARLTRQKTALRFTTDLYLVGVLVDQPQLKSGLVPSVLAGLLNNDHKNLLNLTIAVSFAKFHAQHFIIYAAAASPSSSSAPPAPSDVDHTTATTAVAAVTAPAKPASAPPLEMLTVDLKIKTACTTILTNYFEAVTRILVREHKRVQKIESSNNEYFIQKGEIYEDRQEKYEKSAKVVEKLLAHATTLSEALRLPLPHLPKPESAKDQAASIGIADHSTAAGKDSASQESGMWEDEESRLFYESVVDLQVYVPAMFLNITTTKKPTGVDSSGDGDACDGTSQVRQADGASSNSQEEASELPSSEDAELESKMEELASKMEQDALEPLPTTSSILEDVETSNADAVSAATADPDAQADKSSGSSSSAVLDTLLTRLPGAMNRTAIDELATEFCYIQTKNARKRLVATLVGVPRQRLDLLSYYARMVATLGKYFPEIPTAVLEVLEREFHYHLRKKDQIFIEERIKNIRFIAELIKFKQVPHHVIYHVMKVLLDDFSNNNIDILAMFLETCGRFLFKSPDTAERTSNMLDIMLRKKSIQNVDNRQKLIIENAYYQCNPPDSPACVAKVRPPMEMFIRKLIYTDLCKKDISHILKLLRKLNWDDADTQRTLFKVFSKIHKVKYSNIQLMAYLLSELVRYYHAFGVNIIDHTMEEGRLGLELNLFKLNQRRIANVHYLGELYNYRLVDHGVVFDFMYFLLRFGHADGFPRPGVYSALDAPHDFFRIRLVCTLLETCGHCFDRGVTAEKLDRFLLFFQLYLFSKNAIPRDIDYVVHETLELIRPSFKLASGFEEALSLVNAASAANTSASGENSTSAEDVDMDTDQPQDQQQQQQQGQPDSQEQDSEDGISEEDEGEDSDEEEDDDEQEEGGDDDEDEEEGDGGDSEEGNEEEEQARIEDMEAALAEQEFERELGLIMQESIESRKNEKRPAVFDVAIPSSKTSKVGAFDRINSENGGMDVAEKSHVEFTILTKKGAKSQKRTLELPVNSSFVINTISKKEAEQQEKNQLKKLVLEYDERERYGIVPNELSLGGGSQTAAATGSSSGRTGVSSFSSSSSIRQPRSKKVLWSNISSSASLRRK